MLDGAGRPVDDLVVGAFRPDNTSDVPSASALSYDNPRWNRDHGGFDLYVKPGYFRLLVTGQDSLGNQQFAPRWIGGPDKVWAINEGHQIRLPDQRLIPIGTFDSTTRLSLSPSSNVGVGRDLTITTRVLCPHVAPVRGRVTYVVDGSPLVRRTLENGLSRLTVNADEPGLHTVQIEFSGGPHVNASTSKTVYFSVSRRRH